MDVIEQQLKRHLESTRSALIMVFNDFESAQTVLDAYLESRGKKKW